MFMYNITIILHLHKISFNFYDISSFNRKIIINKVNGKKIKKRSCSDIKRNRLYFGSTWHDNIKEVD